MTFATTFFSITKVNWYFVRSTHHSTLSKLNKAIATTENKILGLFEKCS